MAYVLMVLGALMAAAGLYVIGYGWFDARFEDYWHALAAGATLTAGGIVTVALAFAVRALLDVRAALVAPLADAQAIAPAPREEPAAKTTPVTEAPVAAEATTSPTDPETHLPPERNIPAPTVTRDPHPLRPKPALPELVPFASSTTVGAAQSDFGSSDTGHAIHEPVAAADAETYRPDGDLPGDDLPAPHHEDAVKPQPADDYKLEMPSTPDHDLPLHDAPAGGQSFNQAKVDNESLDVARPTVPPKTDDWLDRALADIDEELPLHTPVPHSPTASLTPSELRAAEPVKPAPLPMPSAIVPPAPVAPELALANAEPLHANGDHVEATTAMPSPPGPASAVIGRYEADGTSYVMYADGSIEAQSSAGVYRFSSMAELKSFIEH